MVDPDGAVLVQDEHDVVSWGGVHRRPLRVDYALELAEDYNLSRSLFFSSSHFHSIAYLHFYQPTVFGVQMSRK
jgi:hypothetical protein